MFNSLLIANRGEIAARIIRTAKRMGLRTIAVYSEADRDAMHVALADVAVPIGPAPARESYLRADRILAAARKTGAAAIHPGYGFLSEKTELALLCKEQGIVWVGPHLEAIAAMGSKIEAKRLAVAIGVPVVPGYHGDDQGDDKLIAEAKRMGFPVMIKAAAGGGGKGMRPVISLETLPAALAVARLEAETAFGDGRLLIEKLMTRPRHVEVQVLGDKHAGLVHLYERDCSVQRNNQKLLEEAPAPNLSQATRDALHRHAVRLAAAIDYDSVGTVEFIVDADTEEFFFLEMNTRLQVEHTVTEEITGLDLVEWQLRVSAGEPLPFRQDDIQIRGHAIQARVTAERADKNFRPDTGTVALWSAPAGIRVDAGVTAGTTVGLYYDSLLAKVIAAAPDRQQAIACLRSGLDDLAVLGLATNRGFLCDALATRAFNDGRATTRLIEDNWPQGWSYGDRDLRLARRLAAVVAWMKPLAHEPMPSPWSSLRGFRTLASSGRVGVTRLSVSFDGSSIEVRVNGGPRRFTIADEDASLAVEIDVIGNVLVVVQDGMAQRFPFTIEGHRVAMRVRSFEGVFHVQLVSETALDACASAQSGDGSSILAPMPGLIANIMVAPGDVVAAGETVAVLESMKLFTDLRATVAGRITRVAAAVGKTIAANALVVAMTPTED